MQGKEVAKLFASLGFNIDTGDLGRFESMITNVKRDIKEFGRGVNEASRKLHSLNIKLRQTEGAINPEKFAKAAGNLKVSMKQMTKAAGEFVAVVPTLETKTVQTAKAIDKLDSRVVDGATGWHFYAQTLRDVKKRLSEVITEIQTVRSFGAGGRITIGGGAGGSRAGSGRPSGGGGANPQNQDGGFGGSTILPFFKPMTPTGMLLGGALGGGYMLKEVIQVGRNMDSMMFKMKAVSRGTAEFNDNMKYVRETSQALATDVEEFGNSYAQIFQGTKAKYQTKEIRAMFTGFNKYFKVLKISSEDQKGALRGISQMFGKEAVQAQELVLQVGQRVADIQNIFARANGLTLPQMKKIMEMGKTTTDMVIKAGILAGQIAEGSGTLEDSLTTGVSAQVRWENTMKWFSHTFTKKIDPALRTLFDLMAVIAKILTPIVSIIGDVLNTVVDGIKVVIDMIKTFIDNISEIPTWFWAISAAVVALIPIVKFGLLGAMIAGFAGAAVAAEKLSKAIALVGARLAAIAPVALFITLMFLLQQLKQHFEGKYNWVSLMSDGFVFLFAKIDQLALRTKNLFAEIAFNYEVFWARARGQAVFANELNITPTDPSNFFGRMSLTNPEYAKNQDRMKIIGEITLRDSTGKEIATTNQVLSITGANLAGAR